MRELPLVQAGVLAERGDGQRAQVEQLGVRRVLLWQDEVAEGDGQRRLGAEPRVGDDADEVLRRQRVEDGDGEGERVVVLRELVLEEEELVVQDVLLRWLHGGYVVVTWWLRGGYVVVSWCRMCSCSTREGGGGGGGGVCIVEASPFAMWGRG